jgi:hypothetical protein
MTKATMIFDNCVRLKLVELRPAQGNMAGPAVADRQEMNSTFQPLLGGADSAASQTCPGFSTASVGGLMYFRVL